MLSYRWAPEGGLAGAESYWVYGDRRVISVAMPEDDDSVAAPVEMEVARAPESHMQYYLVKLRGLGVLTTRPGDFGNPGRPLGPVTWYVNAGDVRREITYQKSRDYDPQLSEEQRDKRLSMRYRLVGALGSAGSVPDTRYQPASTALLVKPVSARENREVRDWPLKDLDHAVPWDGNDVVGNRCMVVPTEKADQITSAMKESEDGVAWRAGGGLYQVRPHPLLPHEKDCATVRPYFWPS